MIDQNRDGFVDVDDLKDILASLGKDLPDKYFEGMMAEAPGPINFTMFLTMFGEKLNGTDPEEVIRNAFQCFDDDHSGKINEDYLRERLTSRTTISITSSSPGSSSTVLRRSSDVIMIP